MVLADNIFFELASAQLFPSLAAEMPSQLDKGSAALQRAFKALECYQDGQLDKALEQYSAGIAAFPNQAFFYACRSLVNEELGDEEGAFYDYQAAKGLDFNYHTFIEWMENKPLATGSTQHFKQLKDASNAALEAVQQFDYETALSIYREAIQASPDEVELLVYSGSLLLRLVRYDLALADFNAALAMDPKHYQAYLSRAKLQVAIREKEGALADFDFAIGLDPTNSLGYEERGSYLIEQGLFEQAITDFNSLVDLLPEDFYVYALRADLFEKMENWAGALADYDKAITFNPHYSDLYSYRAAIKERLGDSIGATADLLRFEEIEADED